MAPRNDAGGRAGAGGFDYQHRGAAWFATRILAGGAAPPVLRLWTTTLRRIDCETEDPVDDSRLRQEIGPPLVAQYKRTIDLSPRVDSELAKTAGQFVDHHRSDGHAADNMALVTSTQASGAVRNTLRLVLDGIRDAGSTTPIDELPRNKEERHTYRVFAGHVDQTWCARTGTNPTETERRALMHRCHVLVLDVEPGGAHEAEARQLLRSVVATDPSQGDAAWDVLIEVCVRMAAERSGACRQQLQEHLLSRGIRLQTVVDYRGDIARLETTTRSALGSLEAGSVTIPSPTGEIHLSRRSVDDIVTNAAAGPLLVVGEPGIGKTVALHYLARHEIASGRPVLFVPVGSTAATSMGELRNELGLEHDLLDVLAEWSPGLPKLVIVDALDAARNDPQADLWRTFIDLVCTQLREWHVVASVRTWDLRHSPRLQAQFSRPPAQLGELDDGELAQLASTWPTLAELVQSAPDDLRRLLRNPFNLRLVADLLLAGLAIAELRTIHDRLELLDRYWERRVSEGQGAMARQSLLSRVCEYTLSHRTLTAPANDVLANDAGAGEVLETLLSRSVLTDATALPGAPGVGAVRFAHHILFDYAVALTVFATEDALTRMLHEDPDLVLFARPSIDMHLERLWTAAPARFWKDARAIASDDALPRLATIAFAEVAARRALVLADVASLLDPILDGTASPAEHRIIRYLTVAVVIDREDQDSPQPGVWPEVVERLSSDVEATELPLRILLDDLLHRSTALTDADFAMCGVAARRQLDYVWSNPPSPIVRFAIDAVVMTASSDPGATETLLRRGLEPGHLAVYGANDLQWLCRAAPRLAAVLPEFAEDLYVAGMAFQEDSGEATPLLASGILPLMSNRKQDVEFAKWELVRHFGTFLLATPEHALAALARLVEGHAQCGAVSVGPLGKRTVRVVADDSYRWDRRHLADEHDIVSLLNSFEDHVAGLQGDQDIVQWLDLLAAVPRPAAIWRRVLAAAARNERVAVLVGPLDEAVATWANDDLVDSLAQLLGARFATRPDAERARVEDAIGAMEPGDSDGSFEWYRASDRYRRLLHALDPAAIVTQDPSSARASSLAPSPIGWHDIATGFEDGDDPYGFTPHAEADRAAWSLLEPVRAFVDEHFSIVPGDDAVHASLVAVEGLLEAPEYQQMSVELREYAESILARAAEIWTRRGDDVDHAALDRAKSLLLDLRSHRLPESSDEEADQRLISIPQGPRTDAARGLLQLGRFPDQIDDDITQAVTALADDEVPWIRHSIARHLPHLRQTSPDVMWDLLCRLAERDSNDGVLRGVAIAAWALRVDLDPAVALLRLLATRVRPVEHSGSALEACTEAAGLFWVLDGHTGARDLLRRLSDTRTYGANAITAMLHEMRTTGALTADDDAIRERALGVCADLVELALAALGDFGDSAQQAGGEPPAERRAAVDVLDSVALQLLAASGSERRQEADGHAPSTREVRLADEAGGLISRLGQVPLPRITHHLVQMLEHVLDARPEQTLLAVRDIITTGGQRGGYQLDLMAAEATVRIVERLLADHRGILQKPECLTAVREVLDVFVDAGWPAAHRLAYGLEHIFR